MVDCNDAIVVDDSMRFGGHPDCLAQCASKKSVYGWLALFTEVIEKKQ